MNQRIIKKYANRRLYDTEASKHVTLQDIRRLIVDGNDIQVIDDTSGEDITRPLLLQIIVEQERIGEPILTKLLLSQLIRFYGNPMQGMMADYLQKSVDTFVDQQQSIQHQMQNMLTHTPLDTMREIMQQNMRSWETLLGHPHDSPGDKAPDEDTPDTAAHPDTNLAKTSADTTGKPSGDK